MDLPGAGVVRKLQQRGNRQTRPSSQERDSPEWRDRTQARRPCQHQGVETTGEDDDACREEPAGPSDQWGIEP